MSSFERICWLYQRLKQNRNTTRRDYMDQFEVSESTFKRDLAFMRDRLGAPVDYSAEQSGYVLTDGAFELPSFWFNRMQLLLLIGISNQLRKMRGLTDGSELSVFRDRLRGLLTLHDGCDIAECFSFEQVEWSACDYRHLDLLMEAILQRRCVSLTYYAAGTDVISMRTVEPYRLHHYMGSWYLIAYCLYRKEPRVFQLARLIRLAHSHKDFQTPRFDVAAFLNNSFGIFKGTGQIEVVLHFDPFIARFIRNEIWFDGQQTEECADGSLIMTFPVADLTEIKMRVLKYGRYVQVIKPVALRRLVADEAAMIVKNYEDG